MEIWLLMVSLTLVVFCGSCGTRTKSDAQVFKREFIVIGTFNIAWFGDGFHDREPRSEADYKRIAGVIAETNVDVLGVQEVENEAALGKLIAYLPNYKCLLGRTGGEQRVGVLFKNDVFMEVVEEYLPLAVEPERTRTGLVLRCRAGNMDWTMMVVHLKSTSRFDSTSELKTRSRELRRAQAERLAEWMSAALQGKKNKNDKNDKKPFSDEWGNEQDILIVGDCNDYPTNEKFPALAAMVAQQQYRFLTMGLESCRQRQFYRGQPPTMAIDHIIASASVQKRYVAGSVTMIGLFQQFSEVEMRTVSDHCPVVCRFDARLPDND